MFQRAVLTAVANAAPIAAVVDETLTELSGDYGKAGGYRGETEDRNGHHEHQKAEEIRKPEKSLCMTPAEDYSSLWRLHCDFLPASSLIAPTINNVLQNIA